MNVCVNRFQNMRQSEEKLCLITKPTFQRNKITSISVRFGAEILNVYLILTFYIYWRRDGSVGITTRYGLDGRGIECRWKRDSPYQSTLVVWAQPASCTVGPDSLSRGKVAGAWR